MAIQVPCNKSPEDIDFISPALRESTPWSTIIHGSVVCYLGCPSIILEESYMTGPSLFLALMTCMMSRTLVLLLIYSFVLWSCQDTPIIALSIFLEQLLCAAPRVWLISKSRCIGHCCQQHRAYSFFFKLLGILLLRWILCSLKLFQPAGIRYLFHVFTRPPHSGRESL